MTRYIIVLFYILLAISLFGQSKKEYYTVKTSESINVDGILSEDSWNKANVASNFFQFRPENNKAANEKTEVKIIYSNTSLYVGAVLYDSQPNTISTKLSKRDNSGLADYFGIAIDTYNDASTAYGFFVTAAGVQIDTKITTWSDNRWNAVWSSAVRKFDKGWIVEMEIPYSELRFADNNKDIWGLNISRQIQRLRETDTWNYMDINVEGQNQQAGLLKGVKDICPPIRLSFYPYLSSYLNKYGDSYSKSIKGGMDLKYGINGSFTLDMMLIPDFGQVKSDDAVLNLSPFETYYGENREFFKEGVSLFNRAGIFYSRRIGGKPLYYYRVEGSMDSTSAIIDNPSTSQLINATKISGKTKSGLSIGFLNAISKNTYATYKNKDGSKSKFLTQPLTNYNVSVIEQTLKNNSYISLINTNMYEPDSNYSANVTGTELRYVIGNSFAIEGSGAISNTPQEENMGFKYRINFEKISGRFRYKLTQNTESKNYNPNDMGYLQSPNERSQKAEVSYSIREPFWKLLNWNSSVSYNYNTLFSYNKFVNSRLQLATNFTTRNNISAGFHIGHKPSHGYDYYEPRVNEYKLQTYSNSWFGGWLSSDYRKMFALDINGGGSTQKQYNSNSFWFGFSPQLRIGDSFQLFYNHNESFSNNEVGHIYDNGVDTVIMGMRDRIKQENKITFNYIFTPKSSLSFYLRHEWTKVKNKKYFQLNKNGTLNQTTYDSDDINFNAFNINLTYTWQFAPGSNMSLVWKKEIQTNESEIANDFSENLLNTLDAISQNSISIRVLYYIDYLKIKNALL